MSFDSRYLPVAVVAACCLTARAGAAAGWTIPETTTQSVEIRRLKERTRVSEIHGSE